MHTWMAEDHFGPFIQVQCWFGSVTPTCSIDLLCYETEGLGLTWPTVPKTIQWVPTRIVLDSGLVVLFTGYNSLELKSTALSISSCNSHCNFSVAFIISLMVVVQHLGRAPNTSRHMAPLHWGLFKDSGLGFSWILGKLRKFSTQIRANWNKKPFSMPAEVLSWTHEKIGKASAGR